MKPWSQQNLADHVGTLLKVAELTERGGTRWWNAAKCGGGTRWRDAVAERSGGTLRNAAERGGTVMNGQELWEHY